MIQKIGDRVSVLGLFRSGQLKPLKFTWNNRQFPVESITSTYTSKDGGSQFTIFAVQSQGNIYKLVFSTKDMLWTLAEVYLEGA